MFVRRSTYHRDMTLLKIELMIASRAPGVVPSAEALEGIRRHLLMALPKQNYRRLRGQWGGRTADAYHRLASMFMAAYSGQPGIGEFDRFRSAVIAAAADRREYLSILAEIHEWLEGGHRSKDVKSQLEDILARKGVEIIRTVEGRRRSDDLFAFDGEGPFMKVISPAYVIEIDGKTKPIRQGYVECGHDQLNDGTNRVEDSELEVDSDSCANSSNDSEKKDGDLDTVEIDNKVEESEGSKRKNTQSEIPAEKNQTEGAEGGDQS